MASPARTVPGATDGVRPGGWSGLVAFLRRHPIVCLAILTPGIPEYLSTSSPLLNLVVNPVWFFLGLAINVGQYTAGALLIREAMVRWGKGWASVGVLALAYGITEEGLGDNTLFNSNRGADGILGSYGRFAGVNWVWSTGVLAFHVIYSIGLPLLLLGLALPETRGRSLIGPRGVRCAFASLAASTALETLIVYGSFHFWMGVPLLVGSLAAIGALVAIAYRLPAGVLAPASDRPTAGPFAVGAIGFLWFPLAFFLEYYVGPYVLPAAALLAVEVAVFVLLGERVRRTIGRRGNERLLVDLAFGFVLWQSAFGLLLTLGVPYTAPLIAVAVYFFVRLRRAYPTSPATAVGTGSTVGLRPN